MSIKLSNIANSSIVVGRCYQKLWISEREKIITIFTILHTHSIDMKYMHTHDNSNKGNVKLIICHNKLWIILKEMGIPNHLTCLLRNLYAGQEATARTEHGTTDWFKIWKRSMLRLYIASLLIQSTSCKILGWMRHKPESYRLEKYQQPQIWRWYHFNCRKQRGTKEPLHKHERGEWKSWLKNQHF